MKSGFQYFITYDIIIKNHRKELRQMNEYFTINQLFTELLFPLVNSILPLLFTYILFEPLCNKLKKENKKTLRHI